MPNSRCAWVYYTSKNHFMALYSWPLADFHWSEDLVTYDFYRWLPETTRRVTRSGPTSIRRRRQRPDGHGRRAVYDGATSSWTLNLDLTLGTMSRFLATGDFGQGRSPGQRQEPVIADSAGAGCRPRRDRSCRVLPSSDVCARRRCQRRPARPFRIHGGWLVQSELVVARPGGC